MSEQNVSPKMTYCRENRRQLKRRGKSPLNDTNIDNRGTRVNSRKDGVKGQNVSCVNKSINTNTNSVT